jgi:hypothetical protein
MRHGPATSKAQTMSDRAKVDAGGTTMKPAYLGGVRGYQSAVYRPGAGWTGYETHRHWGHQPVVFSKRNPNRAMHVSPLAVATRRRPGLKTKTAIVASVMTIAGVLALVLTGVAQI